ncbi:MAG: acyl-CoA dehydrogenase family protein [Promethearchaeota archaeon]
MNFELGEKHKLVRRSVRSFAEKVLAPLAPIMDREEEFYPNQYRRNFKNMCFYCSYCLCS